MFLGTVLEFNDASYFVDWLVERNGGNRDAWAGIPIERLRRMCLEEYRKLKQIN